VAGLDIQGAFLITIGHGQGPETELALSVAREDGTPVLIDFNEDRVDVFLALSAMFGAFSIPLRIVNVQPMPLSFWGLRLEAPDDLGVTLVATVPAALGIVIETEDGDRGQGIACSCAGAHVTPWFGERVQDAPG
jgi:hypothetical protein